MFNCPIINLLMLPLRKAFKLIVLIMSALKLALFSSISFTLFLSSLVLICKVNCQFIILQIVLANLLNKTWILILFRWSLSAFRCLIVSILPWFNFFICMCVCMFVCVCVCVQLCVLLCVRLCVFFYSFNLLFTPPPFLWSVFAYNFLFWCLMSINRNSKVN